MAAKAPRAFIPKPDLVPPSGEAGALGWLRKNLFRSRWDALLTIVCVYALGVAAHSFFQWAVTDAVWSASSRRECLDTSPDGACWAGVIAWARSFVYGRYPASEYWRINLATGLVLLWAAPMFMRSVPRKTALLGVMICAYPVLAGYLLLGGTKSWGMQIAFGVALAGLLASAWHVLGGLWRVRFPGDPERAGGPTRPMRIAGLAALTAGLTAICWRWQLPLVKTNLWGGMFLTMVIAVTGIAISMPGGIVLALGRRSRLPLIRAVVTAYIELLRSVPLITVLFMAVTMTPLFLPVERNPDKLVLALVAIGMFASAYMAEVVRGGLQSVPLGQLEAARSIGLSYWQTMRLVMLPQALRNMIPNIASSFIGLLKDTTVVAIIGLYDFSLMLRAPGSHPTWIGLHIETFVLGGIVYFVMCYSVSRYSRRLERRLDTSLQSH